MRVSVRLPQRSHKVCQWRDHLRSLDSESSMPAIRRCSEGVGGVPKTFILRDPGGRLGFGGKAGGRLRQSAGPGHLRGEAVIVSLNIGRTTSRR